MTTGFNAKSQRRQGMARQSRNQRNVASKVAQASRQSAAIFEFGQRRSADAPLRVGVGRFRELGAGCRCLGLGLLSSSQINHFQSAASLMDCNL
jgi:hypothetical protein